MQNAEPKLIMDLLLVKKKKVQARKASDSQYEKLSKWKLLYALDISKYAGRAYCPVLRDLWKYEH